MPSILEDKIIIEYDHKRVKLDVYDTPLGKRFIEALKDNLVKKKDTGKELLFPGVR